MQEAVCLEQITRLLISGFVPAEARIRHRFNSRLVPC